MADKQGYIKAYRQLVNWEWYTDIPVKTLFLHLLLIANHTSNSWRGQVIEQGSCITSIDHLSTESGLTKQQVRTALKKLQKTKEIEIVTTNKNTVVKVLGYAKYQGINGTEQQTNNKQITNEQQTNNKQITTNKNDKNDKNDKKYIVSDEIKAEFDEFVAMRKRIKKPMSKESKKRLVNELNRLAPNNFNLQKKMLLKAADNCWLSVYPLKETKVEQNKPKGKESYDINQIIKDTQNNTEAKF